ncbi:BPSL0067 family protein [Massilia sp.]|uniref:BPSL0067 family protein n=1 Tax=Massilia sp. TaxID=1882437 RepID=UPI00352C1030
MPHPVVYLGNFNALLREWEDKAKQVYKEQGRDGLKHLMIANGECARLPQALTGVGWTGRWQRGERVIDVARTLKPGTVIANFRLIDGKWQYPRGTSAEVHGNHAALFMSADSYVGGKPTRVMMFDQWRSGTPKWPSPRPVYVRPEAIAKAKQRCDRAEDFYVVLVP